MCEQKELSLMCLSQLPPGSLWFSDQMIPNECPLSDSTENITTLWSHDTLIPKIPEIHDFPLCPLKSGIEKSPGLLAPTNVQEFPTRFQQFHGLHNLASILWWLRVIENGENVGKCGENVGKMMIYHGNVEDLDEKLRTAPWLTCWSYEVLTFAGTQHAKCFTSAHFRMMKPQSSLVIFSPRIVLQLNAWNPKLQLCRIFWTCHPRGPACFGSQNVAQLGLSECRMSAASWMGKSWSTIELAYFWTKPDWIQIERQSNRGFLKWKYPKNHPGHGWPWLSIETHGEDWGSKPFREPPMKWSVFTDHASALAILLNCRLGDWSYVAHIDLGCSSKLLTHWLDQVMYLSYWRWKSWCFEYSKYLQRQWISRSQRSNSGPLFVRWLDQQMQRVPSAQQNKRSSMGMNLSLRSWQQKTRRRLARERNRCVSSSSEYGSRKR